MNSPARLPARWYGPADAIDPVARTLNVEVDVDNPDGHLLPGAYARAFPAAGDLRVATVTVPSNALIFRNEGLQVGVVRDGKAQLVPVKIGRDYGDKVEIVSGLQAADNVILDPAIAGRRLGGEIKGPRASRRADRRNDATRLHLGAGGDADACRLQGRPRLCEARYADHRHL